MDAQDRRRVIEDQLRKARITLAALPRGSTAYRNALAAVRQLERMLFAVEDLPPTVAPPVRRGRAER